MTLDQILDLTLIVYVIGIVIFAILLGFVMHPGDAPPFVGLVLWPVSLLVLLGALIGDMIDRLKGIR